MPNLLSLGLISLDYPEPLQVLFETAARRRFSHVEIYVQESVEPKEADTVHALKEQHGIQVVSVSSLAKLNQAEADLAQHEALVRGSIRLAAEVGAPFATFMYGGNATLGREAARERFLRRMEPMVEEAVRRGVVLLLENVFSRVPPGDLDRADFTAELMERLDRRYVGLNFDISNYGISGDEAYPYAYRRLQPYIRYMHWRDVARYEPEWYGELDGRRPLLDHQRGVHISVPLGTGMVNFEGFLEEFVRDGYSGVVSLEPFAHGPRREEWLDRSLAYLEARGLYKTP